MRTKDRRTHVVENNATKVTVKVIILKLFFFFFFSQFVLEVRGKALQRCDSKIKLGTLTLGEFSQRPTLSFKQKSLRCVKLSGLKSKCWGNYKKHIKSYSIPMMSISQSFGTLLVVSH